MGNTFGSHFQITTFGESHGPAVGVVIDGCPSKVSISLDDIAGELARRRPGQSRLTTQRDEADQIEVLSGVEPAIPVDARTVVTTGTPIAMIVRNKDARSGAYDHLSDLYRPSHADFTYDAKYGTRSIAGGGRSSARETIGRVAAGSVAAQLLRQIATTTGVEPIEIVSWVSEVNGIASDADPLTVTRTDVEADPTRCGSPLVAQQMVEAIEQARRDGDSLGGAVSCVIRNVPVGLGEPVFDRLDAELAKAMMSLPATKGFELGSGFSATTMTGRSHNDAFIPGPEGVPVTTSNHSGGVQGGISNGAPITMRIAFKPTATISSPQQTVDRQGNAVTLEAKGRHDPCVLPRAVPMVDAMASLVLGDHYLRQLRHGLFNS